MYSAKVILNNKEFTGTLNFEVLVNTIYELENLEVKITMPELLIALTNRDIEIVTVFIIQSIAALEQHSKIEVIETYMSSVGDIEQDFANFNSIFEYILELFKKCIPKKKKDKKESIFDDEEEEFDLASDWDLADFQYLWETVLKRTDFYKITPKMFFDQLDIHSKTISKQGNNSNVTEL